MAYNLFQSPPNRGIRFNRYNEQYHILYFNCFSPLLIGESGSTCFRLGVALQLRAFQSPPNRGIRFNSTLVSHATLTVEFQSPPNRGIRFNYSSDTPKAFL